MLVLICRGRGLSRAAYARLYAAGFSPLRDRNGEPPEVIDPHGQHLINVAREQVDPLQANEVIFQFLAYSKSVMLPALVGTDVIIRYSFFDKIRYIGSDNNLLS